MFDIKMPLISILLVLTVVVLISLVLDYLRLLRRPARLGLWLAMLGIIAAFVILYLNKHLALKVVDMTVGRVSSGLAVRLSASFGLASYPDDAADSKSLLARADKALFRVKQTGKGCIGTA